MEIKWLGHSCFKISENGYSIVIDPFENNSVPGLKNIKEEANLVICSHEHFDHNARHTVVIKNNEKIVPFSIKTINTFHDDKNGSLRGLNNINIISNGKIRIAHLGDLGCNLTENQLNELTNLDAVLIPIGGTYTINCKQAFELVEKIKPKTIIPMHYRSNTFGFEVLETVDKFKSFFKDALVLNTNTITINCEVAYPNLVILKYL